jgi:hypothetical protein
VGAVEPERQEVVAITVAGQQTLVLTVMAVQGYIIHNLPRSVDIQQAGMQVAVDQVRTVDHIMVKADLVAGLLAEITVLMELQIPVVVVVVLDQYQTFKPD